MFDNKIIHKFCYEVNGYINSVSRIYNEIIEGSFDFDIKAAKKVGADFKNDLCSACAKGFGGEPIHLAFLSFEPAWVTVVISGVPLLYLAIWRIIHNPGISKISSALLICIAMFAAIAIGDLFAAGEVAFIMAIGALLEEATTNRAKKGLKQLINLAPTKGRRLTNGKEEIIPAEEIIQGDVLRILPGETIPG